MPAFAFSSWGAGSHAALCGITAEQLRKFSGAVLAQAALTRPVFERHAVR